MSTALVTVLLLAAIPKITGGTPEQQAAIQRAMETVPPCIRDCGGAPPDVNILDDNGFDAEARAVDGKGVINITSGAMTGTGITALQNDPSACGNTALGDLGSNIPRVMLHEAVHIFHHLCAGAGGGAAAAPNEGLFAGFLDQNFNAAYAKWQNDPVNIQTWDKINAALAKGDQKAACALNAELVARYDKAGLPARYPGDMHALDDNGGEYISIAIETLVYDQKKFCGTYSANEQQWLASHLADCMKSLPARAPCLDQLLRPLPTGKPTGPAVFLKK